MRKCYKSNLLLSQCLNKTDSVETQPICQTPNNIIDLSVSQDTKLMSAEKEKGLLTCTPLTSQRQLTGFTPPLKRGRQLMEKFLSFGAVNCSLLNIKSLEPVLTRGELAVLRSHDPQFRVGWLYDSVLDAFFWCLKQQNDKLQVLPACVMTLLQNELPSSGIWKGENIINIQWVMAPWNPTGAHWTLVTVSIKDKTIFFLDPMQLVDINNSFMTAMLKQFLFPFLDRYDWINFKIKSPPHTLQSDGTSCGVMVCWYARQLIQGKSLIEKVDQRHIRVEIYETIRGNCLQRFYNPNIRISVCPVCRSESTDAIGQFGLRPERPSRMRTGDLDWQKGKMVVSCCIVGCTNRFEKGGSVKFFRVPRGKRQRRAWVKAINRKDFVPNEYTRVCSVHFVTGWPDYVDPHDVDFAPSVFRYKQKVPTPTQQHRLERSQRRAIVKTFEEASDIQKKFVGRQLQMSIEFHDYCAISRSASAEETPVGDSSNDIEVRMEVHDEEHVGSQSSRSIGTMTDDHLITENCLLKAENESLRQEVKQLKDELRQKLWSTEKIKDDDKATQFYTGLPSYAVFLWLFRYLEAKASTMTYWNGDKKTKERQRNRPLKLSLINQLLAVLMRLKVGLFVKDISDRFDISVGTFSKIFNTWIILIQKEMALLNPFPSKELVSRYLPAAFRKYPNTRIVIDCTEVYVERSSALSAQNETFSSYKHHNTWKFLVGISPGGVFTFLSDAWGGRVSDKEIVKGSGFLDLIEPGDNVMADKGFTIADLLKEKGAYLNIPPFLSSQVQFSQTQVQQTRDIAEVRIHVERAIGRLKKFHILDGTLPLSLKPYVTEIFHVCAYLTNLSEPIVTTTQL